MPNLTFGPDKIYETEDGPRYLMTKDGLDKFNPHILGLGNLSTPSKAIPAIAAVFDLEGFTYFCGQIEPQLSVPAYLNKFLTWLLEQIKTETIRKAHEQGAELWHPLPFFIKFMGDGLLILWNASDIDPAQARNLVVSMNTICDSYEDTLLPKINASIVAPPTGLRCGIARGTVFSVGDEADYIGSCINMAARLQKLPGVSFALNRRGFEIDDEDAVDYFRDAIVTKKVNIRGIGSAELVCILESDYAKMSANDKASYKTP
ncbi:MAG: hypothetical protein H7067_11130 [Burkholderiales bacterium]|nr:hypothetical protein [Opitutaceae bacterium]